MHTAEDFKKLAQQEKDSRLRIRYLALYHFKNGLTRTKIALNLGVARGSVNKWVTNYLSEGLAGLETRKSPGRPNRLSQKQLNNIVKFVERNSVKPDGGRLMAEDVHSFINDNFGVDYGLRNIYRLLHSLGFSWITSRSKHPKQSQAAQDAFKKVPTGNDPSHSF